MLSLDKALEKRIEWRKKNKIVVFTNGVFDILHRGHVDYLNQARQLGDILLVGLNTDNSVRRLKGDKRPLMLMDDRAFLLENLKAVDNVIPFDEDTPLNLISQLLPDILVKGADYEIKDIVGSDIVLANGGKVIPISLTEGKSTSGIVEIIRNRYCDN